MPDQRIDTLIANIDRILRQLRDIRAESEAKQEAAIAASGLPRDLVLRLLKTSPLPTGDRLSSISVDMSQPNSTAVAPIRDRRGRPLETDARFPRALEAAGSNIDRWSKEHGYNPKRVRSWYQKSGGRRIPRKIAEAIEMEMGKDDKGRPVVPASLESWPNGIAN